MTTRNTYPEWAGIEKMIELQQQELERFRRWAAIASWRTFHVSKYDWWAFPINRQSQHGYEYTVFEEEIAQLKTTPDYLDNLRELARLQMLAYGWDLDGCCSIAERGPNQRFEGDTRVARLEKCARSLQCSACAMRSSRCRPSPTC